MLRTILIFTSTYTFTESIGSTIQNFPTNPTPTWGHITYKETNSNRKEHNTKE